jgi:aminoglycoside phosphotransferase (APT) family kinase protein
MGAGTVGAIDADSLRDVVRTALGADHRISGVTALRGGSKKGVYRVTCTGGATVIVYIWDDTHDHWPVGPNPQPDDGSNPLAHASGLDLFVAAHERLSTLGVRTPHVALVDASQRSFPSDIAIVEDVTGRSLEALLQEAPQAATPIIDELADLVERMHRSTDQRFGRVAVLAAGGHSAANSCQQLVVDSALRNLRDAAARDTRIGAAHEALERRLLDLAAAVIPRDEHGLIHGELGPDHVLIDSAGHPVLIDIEALMQFDVEWEHAFMRIRFHDRYPDLLRVPLDDARLALYTLATRVSLVAGPLRLLDGGFPDRPAMQQIAEHNVVETLALR